MFSIDGLAMELYETLGNNLVLEWDICFPMGTSKILEPAFLSCNYEVELVLLLSFSRLKLSNDFGK